MAVVRECVPEDGDQDVEVTITLDIDDRGMGRSSHAGLDRMLAPVAAVASAVGDQPVGEGVAGEDFGFRVTVEIDDLDVADPGRDLDRRSR